MSPRQFLTWEAYAELEPFDETRADIRTARIEAALYNINRDQKKHPKPFPVSDFVPDYAAEVKPRKKQTVEDQMMVFKMLSAALTPEVKD